MAGKATVTLSTSLPLSRRPNRTEEGRRLPLIAPTTTQAPAMAGSVWLVRRSYLV
jgi:hypothetical protein